MSITDELREYFGKSKGMFTDHVLAIADRIDAEHEKAIRELNNLADASVLLPVDADGVPIHIGEELDYLEALHPNVSSRFKVQDMFYFGKGEWRLRANLATYEPEKCRHHYTSSVEDLILDTISRCVGHLPEYWNKPIAECAAKLKLIEEEDE